MLIVTATPIEESFPSISGPTRYLLRNSPSRQSSPLAARSSHSHLPSICELSLARLRIGEPSLVGVGCCFTGLEMAAIQSVPESDKRTLATASVLSLLSLGTRIESIT